MADEQTRRARLARTLIYDDTIVELVIPTDATCPVGLGTFRDRLGLGKVCIEID